MAVNKNVNLSEKDNVNTHIFHFYLFIYLFKQYWQTGTYMY